MTATARQAVTPFTLVGAPIASATCPENRPTRAPRIEQDMLSRARALLPLLLASSLAGTAAIAQTSVPAAVLPLPPPAAADTAPPYIAPTRHQLFVNYAGDIVGPYPLLMATFTAAIHQGTDSPPDWHQGAGALAMRFGSNMGITAVGNTTRFALAAALHQDTRYYRCRCRGWLPRLRHAGLSAALARRRSDGAEVPSPLLLLAPYAATTTATYAWYPPRFGAKDAFRMGNYNLLGAVGTDIAFEFIPPSVWHALSRFHLSSQRMATQN